MVCAALEHRDVPQDHEVRLQGGGLEIAICVATSQLDGDFRHHELANLLDDDVKSIGQSMTERIVLTPLEVDLLDRLVTDQERDAKHKRLPEYLTKIARLGGYLARASDPPPGNMVMWRGLGRLTDIAIGFALATETCG